MDKLIPTWNEKYSIHDTMIDIQHQKLFELADKVESAVYKFVKREELKEILTELFNYMKEHFNNEEQYMQEIHYPYLNEHKIMHKNIIRDMSYLIQNIKTTNDLKEKLYTIMSEWLLEHILYEDMKVEQYRRSSLASEDDGEVSFEEVKEEKDDENAVYLYTCECVGQMHDVPFGIHQKIQLKGVKFKCKKCKEAIQFYKKYSENF
ncbi:hemerythrin family non-heme iron protein [Campylobacter jejuni]|nr:hemerythrin family protein [Campylobacter jejuni]EAC2003845.1 hemerythrin family non-heme iron protein [Campylobacter jejuni]EAH4754365.1 hemerythrin family non-heme iron protein [Campylobacter jejuni]EAH4808502.1 hemerythrin family non-heme iron protein [Campylobacter jejuni]EAH4859785.1 hemerythrin family non-heme iron protein [Campylobacter jejuni]EAH5158229.1 hemerythrin family non-heme iron protein [Campylobacter jejuni]